MTWRPRRIWVVVAVVFVALFVSDLVEESSWVDAFGAVSFAFIAAWAIGGSVVLEGDTISKRYFGRILQQHRLPARLEMTHWNSSSSALRLATRGGGWCYGPAGVEGTAGGGD